MEKGEPPQYANDMTNERLRLVSNNQHQLQELLSQFQSDLHLQSESRTVPHEPRGPSLQYVDSFPTEAQVMIKTITDQLNYTKELLSQMQLRYEDVITELSEKTKDISLITERLQSKDDIIEVQRKSIESQGSMLIMFQQMATKKS